MTKEGRFQPGWSEARRAPTGLSPMVGEVQQPHNPLPRKADHKGRENTDAHNWEWREKHETPHFWSCFESKGGHKKERLGLLYSVLNFISGTQWLLA